MWSLSTARHTLGTQAGAGAPSGPQRSWLLRQMELDTAFLRDLNLLDYSLLMASQRLQEDERGPGSSLVFRTARWAPTGAPARVRWWEMEKQTGRG